MNTIGTKLTEIATLKFLHWNILVRKYKIKVLSETVSHFTAPLIQKKLSREFRSEMNGTQPQIGNLQSVLLLHLL